MTKIENKNVLIIPDIHQDTEWAKGVLDKEKGKFNHVVFLGDFFDSFKEPPEVSSTWMTCQFIKEVIAGKYGDYTLLFGNHDICYYEAGFYLRRHENPHVLRTYCSGYTNSKAKDIASEISLDDWRKFEVFKVVNDRLISHAGFVPNLWPHAPGFSIDEILTKLYDEATEAVKLLPGVPSRFFNVGYARSGKDGFPGPFWTDWNEEFTDDLPISQIVGHTPGKEARQIGTSFCVDTNQKGYATIYDDILRTPGEHVVQRPYRRSI